MLSSVSIAINFLTLEGISLIKLQEGIRGEGGGNNRSLPSTFDTSHLIDLIFGIYNELPLYFQLS